MKNKLNLILIGDISCSTTRTYLEYLKNNNYKIEAIWLINFQRKSNFKNKIKLFISRFFVNKDKLLSNQFNKKDKKFKKLIKDIQNELKFNSIDFSNKFELNSVTSKIKIFNFTNYKDPNLQKLIKENIDNTFLYTNGGIVPKSLLNDQEVKILHIHPGIVPEFKGSDCLLWSGLKSGKFGTSCFYMNNKIDEGNLISTKTYKIEKISCLKKPLENKEDDVVYSSILYAYDPHLRASLLIDTIKNNKNLNLKKLPCKSQDNDKFYPYLWMHKQIRESTLRKLFL